MESLHFTIPFCRVFHPFRNRSGIQRVFVADGSFLLHEFERNNTFEEYLYAWQKWRNFEEFQRVLLIAYFFTIAKKKRKERKIAVEKNSKVNAIGIIFTVFRLPFREKLLEKSNPLGCLFIRAKSKEGEFYTGKVKFVTFVRVLEKFDFFLRNFISFFLLPKSKFFFRDPRLFYFKRTPRSFSYFFLSFLCMYKKKKIVKKCCRNGERWHWVTSCP